MRLIPPEKIHTLLKVAKMGFPPQKLPHHPDNFPLLDYWPTSRLRQICWSGSYWVKYRGSCKIIWTILLLLRSVLVWSWKYGHLMTLHIDIFPHMAIILKKKGENCRRNDRKGGFLEVIFRVFFVKFDQTCHFFVDWIFWHFCRRRPK